MVEIIQRMSNPNAYSGAEKEELRSGGFSASNPKDLPSKADVNANHLLEDLLCRQS